MDSDLVDAITETSESMQVAELLRDTYHELIQREEWDFLHGPVSITGAGDTNLPTKFTSPADLRRLNKLWYNIDESGGVQRRELCWVDPVDFLNRLGSGAAAGNRTLCTAGTQLQFYVWNDRQPSFYTSFDGGKTIFCDAFKATIDSTLQTSKVSAWGVANPVFTVDDLFVPNLPEHMVPLLQASLNSAAHLLFKQSPNAVDGQRVARSMANARRRESKVQREHYYSNGFGRR